MPFNDDFNCVGLFSPIEEAPDQVSGSEDCTRPEETEEQQQESSTEIRITVKEEEVEPLNSKEMSLKECKCYSSHLR